MRAAIAITLLLAAVTAGLGINRQVEIYRYYRGWRFLTVLVLTAVVMIWSAVAAAWVFWRA